LTGRAR